MGIRRVREAETEIISLTSLIDVMFILVIFLLATTTFQLEERDIQVTLPDSAEGLALSSASKVIVINIRQDGTCLVGSQEATLQKLKAIMTKAVAADPNQKVLVRGDRKAAHGHVADAVAVCKLAGVREANIGYKVSGQ